MDPSQDADAAQAETLYSSLACSALVAGLGPWGCEYHCQAGFDATRRYSNELNVVWCAERASIRRNTSVCWAGCADATADAIELAGICTGASVRA